jgi:hypothetical protein
MQEINENTIMSGIICRKCGATLPPHTVKQHLNTVFVRGLHNCEDELKRKRLAESKEVRQQLKELKKNRITIIKSKL